MKRIVLWSKKRRVVYASRHKDGWRSVFYNSKGAILGKAQYGLTHLEVE